MTRLRSVLSLLVLAPLAVSLSASCSSSKRGSGSSANKTADQFCESFAKAACNDSVVSKCSGGGTDVDQCIASQSDFCMSALGIPEGYRSTHAQACLDAVRNAYKDAKLTADEVKVVRQLADPCDKLIAGPGGTGASCAAHYECNTVEGLSCVVRPGQPTGTCQIPEVVGGGFSCTAPQQVCEDAFYCNGQNCVARPSTEAAACAPEIPCTDDFKCIGSGTNSICTIKADAGGSCSADIDCKSGVCIGVCVNEVELGPTVLPYCEDLR
jgi:hypothetical protein